MLILIFEFKYKIQIIFYLRKDNYINNSSNSKISTATTVSKVSENNESGKARGQKDLISYFNFKRKEPPSVIIEDKEVDHITKKMKLTDLSGIRDTENVSNVILAKTQRLGDPKTLRKAIDKRSRLKVSNNNISILSYHYRFNIIFKHTCISLKKEINCGLYLLSYKF